MSPTEFAYRRLLALYPPNFRDRFGDEMLQTLRDRLADGATPGAAFWLAVLVDEAPAIVRARWESRPPGPLPLVQVALFVPLMTVYLAALITVSQAIPHPPVYGIGFPLALASLLGAAAWMSGTTLGTLRRAPR